MKNYKTFLPLCMGILLAFGLTAQNFEGIIKMKSDSPYGINADFTVKGEQVMLESASPKGNVKMIFTQNSPELITIVEEGGKRMAVKNNLEANPYMQKYKNHTSEPKDDFRFEVTTETKKIGNYNCVKVIGEDKNSEGVAWVTKELGFNLADIIPSSKLYANGSNPFSKEFGDQGFVMELYVKEINTKREWTMKAEVEEKAIAASAFEIPEGIPYMDMTDMRKIMLEAQKDPAKMQELKEMMQKFQGSN